MKDCRIVTFENGVRIIQYRTLDESYDALPIQSNSLPCIMKWFHSRKVWMGKFPSLKSGGSLLSKQEYLKLKKQYTKCRRFNVKVLKLL